MIKGIEIDINGYSESENLGKGILLENQIRLVQIWSWEYVIRRKVNNTLS